MHDKVPAPTAGDASRENREIPRFAAKWWIAMRPFSFPASAMPVALGTAAAVHTGGARFNAVHFVLALLGMTALHGAANIINDAYDFRRGIDREVLPVSGAVVRGYLTPEQALRGGAVLAAAGCLAGLYLAWAAAFQLLLLGALGVGIGLFYSAAPLGLKYRALGDLCVFLNFGVFGALGAWMVQTGGFSWLPAIWAIPQSLLVVAILHANNWRDIAGDRTGGFSTVASLLGDKFSLVYYAALLIAPFVLVLVFIIAPRIADAGVPFPITGLLVFLALPAARTLLRKAAARHEPEKPLDFAALDGATAQLNLIFGLLNIAALLAARFLEG